MRENSVQKAKQLAVFLNLSETLCHLMITHPLNVVMFVSLALNA